MERGCLARMGKKQVWAKRTNLRRLGNNLLFIPEEVHIRCGVSRKKEMPNFKMPMNGLTVPQLLLGW
jgi:hypothetical protein